MPRYGGFRIGGRSVGVSRRHQTSGPQVRTRGPRVIRDTDLATRECAKCGESYWAGDYSRHVLSSSHASGTSASRQRECKRCGLQYQAGEYKEHSATRDHQAALAGPAKPTAAGLGLAMECLFCGRQVNDFLAHDRDCRRSPKICTIDGCNARRHTYRPAPASMCSEHNAMFKVLQHELANHTGRTAGATALLRAYEASADGLGVLKNSLNRRYGTSDDAADLHKSMEAARARANTSGRRPN